MGIRDRLGIGERLQKQLTWLMEAVMFLVLLVGVWRGETTVIVNAGVALGIAQLVPVLERNYDIPLDAGLTLWITSAVFLHAFGTIGVPGAQSFYRTIPWWDDMTHTLSSSVVAAVGYTTVRALDEHSDTIHLPDRFVFIFILLFVMAFGVLWEVLEFALAEIAAILGTGTVLTQYGLVDTLTDLVFDTLGAVIVATWGSAYLNDVTAYVKDRLDARTA